MKPEVETVELTREELAEHLIEAFRQAEYEMSDDVNIDDVLHYLLLRVGFNGLYN